MNSGEIRRRSLRKRWIKDAHGLIRSENQEGKKPSAYTSTSRSNELKRLTSGIFVEKQHWEHSSPREQLKLATLAQVPEGAGAIIVGAAAAALHGLPLAGKLPARGIALAATTRPRASYHGFAVRRVGSAIHEIDIVHLHGRRVTDIPKTVVDLCRYEDPRDAVVVADAALRGWVSAKELAATLSAYPQVRGNARARAILGLTTELSETPGESLTKFAIVQSGIVDRIANAEDLWRPSRGAGAGAGAGGAGAGGAGAGAGVGGRERAASNLADGLSAHPRIPATLYQQVNLSDKYGLIGRVDFYIPELGLVIEFDGDVKYTNGNAAETERRIRQELKREKRLKNLGLEVVRLSWRDVIEGDCVDSLREVGEELAAAIANGKRIYRGKYVVELPYLTVSARVGKLGHERQLRWMRAGRLY